jgi:argininosuccinate lyase
MMTNNLPSGYFRDLQLIKESFLPAFDELKSCMEIAAFALSEMEVKPDILDDERYRYVYSVEDVNRLVMRGVPFRDAYKKVGMEIQNGHYQPGEKIVHTHAGSIGNLCLAQIEKKMQLTLRQFKFEKVDKAIHQLLE